MCATNFQIQPLTQVFIHQRFMQTKTPPHGAKVLADFLIAA